MGWLCAPSDNYPMHGMLQQRGGRPPAWRSKRPSLRNELFLYALQILLIELIFFELTKTGKKMNCVCSCYLLSFGERDIHANNQIIIWECCPTFSILFENMTFGMGFGYQIGKDRYCIDKRRSILYP